MAQVETASAVRADAITGSHVFMVVGYSLMKEIGVGKFISSEVFNIGGYDWVIQYYPDGERNEAKSFLSFYLHLRSDVANDVKARFTFSMLQWNGVASNMSMTSPVVTFRRTHGSCSSSHGYRKFADRNYFETSECLNNNTFTLKCIVTVVKGTKLELVPRRSNVVVPWPNLNQNLTDLLGSGQGADITFVLKGERFNAHRCVLAARSTVFSAELFGSMKENWTDTITIEDIEPPIFKSMLHYIYSDFLVNFEEQQDLSLVTPHLLVAADRYGLERLRLICEDILCNNLSVSSVATTLILAEQHNCVQLKADCLRFMRSPQVFKAVAQTDEFQNLVNICPSVLKEI